jgi:hypothetical protein
MIYIVFGIHRTGTSVVSNLLHDAGINMGEAFNGPARENPHGFFEDRAIRAINDSVLHYSGYHIKTFSPVIPPLYWHGGHFKKAVALLRSRMEKGDCGWKDPRTVLTMRMWDRVLDVIEADAKLIVTLRNPYSVTRSLQRRGNVKVKEHGLRLYSAYAQHLYGYLARTRFEICFVQYENLEHDMAILEEFTGRKMNRAVFDPALNREDYLKGA